MSSATINGHTYTDDNNAVTGLGAGGHRTRFIPLIADVVTVAGQVAANTALTQANKNSSETANSQATQSAASAALSKVAAAASAETARAIVGIPPAYASLIMQPNRIDTDMTIPDGQNAVIFGDFEVNPDVTVTGLGNSCFVGMG